MQFNRKNLMLTQVNLRHIIHKILGSQVEQSNSAVPKTVTGRDGTNPQPLARPSDHVTHHPGLANQDWSDNPIGVTRSKSDCGSGATCY